MYVTVVTFIFTYDKDIMNDLILAKIHDHFKDCEPKRIPKGKTIIIANHEPSSIFFLQEGIVEQYDTSAEGSRITVNIYKPPAFFPMSWAMNKTPNTYFYGALTDVVVRQEDPAVTLAFLKSNPDVMYDLLSRVFTGTDALLRRLILAVSGIASNRLIYELLIEAYRFGQAIDEKQTHIKVKQSVLAARSGLARETVSRELHKLEQNNLLSRTSHGIVVNIHSLEARLDFTI